MSAALEPITSDRAACAVCADWLATGTLWSQATLLAVLGALAAAVTGTRFGNAPAVLLSVLAVGLVERYLATRVALDASLIARLARVDACDLATLDSGLQRVLAVPPAKSGRPLSARIAGARRLYRAQVASTLLLLALDVVAWQGR